MSRIRAHVLCMRTWHLFVVLALFADALVIAYSDNEIQIARREWLKTVWGLADPDAGIAARYDAQGSTHVLSCSGGGVISVVSVQYGCCFLWEPNGGVCSATSDQCGSNKALAMIQGKCHGRSSCSVQITNQVFGGPCYDTLGSLLTLHHCINSSPPIQDITCEGGWKTMTCPSGTVISVSAAVYGRNADSSICPHTATSDQNCAAGTSLITVQNLCNGQSTCTVGSNNDFFRDPCPGTHKYLMTSYRCVPSTSSQITYNALACEGTILKISCPNSRIIGVLSANFGRDDSITCPHSEMSNTRCNSATSLIVAVSACTGRSSCSISATIDVFGDPCPGTHKYLRVAYVCNPASPSSSPTPSTTPSLSPSASISPTASPKPSCYSSSLVTSTYPVWQYNTSNCAAVAHGGSCTVGCYLSNETATSTATCNSGTFMLTYPPCSSTAYSWGLHLSDMTCGSKTNGASRSGVSWQSCVEQASKNCSSSYITWVSSTQTCQMFQYSDCRSPTAQSGSYIFSFKGTVPGFTPTLVSWKTGNPKATTLVAQKSRVFIENENTNALVQSSPAPSRSPRAATSATKTFTFTVSDSNCYDSVATNRTWVWMIYGTPAGSQQPVYLANKTLSRQDTTFTLNAATLTAGANVAYTLTIVPVTWDRTQGINSTAGVAGLASPGCKTSISASTTNASGSCV